MLSMAGAGADSSFGSIDIWKKRPDRMKSENGDNLSWELVETSQIYSYNIFSVHINRSRSPRTGKIHEFQVLGSPDWVAVIALTKAKEVILVNQYRHGVSKLSLELPGGLVKGGQKPERSAREELEEETGYLALNFEYLGWMYPLPAIFKNKFHVYFAENAEPTGNFHPDETEELETVLVPASQIRDYIRSGKINCGVMIAAIALGMDRL